MFGWVSRLIDGIRATLSLILTSMNSNWWHLGMAGKLPEFLCPSACVGQQDFVGLDFYWAVSDWQPWRLLDLLKAGDGKFDQAPVWPGAFYGKLRYCSSLFPKKAIMIIENGCVEKADGLDRVGYLERHAREVRRAVRDGINVTAYVCWSITSNREWGLEFGPSNDFGLYHIDLDSEHAPLARIPTAAATAFKNIISGAKAMVTTRAETEDQQGSPIP
jgi:Glycosyl hydrolase family 1